MAAGKAIIAKVEDARSHAESALTNILIDTPDGRPSVRRAARSRSLLAALNRLDELHEMLWQEILPDAWEEAFRDAWTYARGEAHPDDLRSHDQPTAAMIRQARSIVLDGYTARSMLDGPIATAKRSLKALVPSVATTNLSAKHRLNSLKAWQVKTSKAIGQAVGSAIFTGAYRQEVMAGRLVLRPELLHDDPSMLV